MTERREDNLPVSGGAIFPKIATSTTIPRVSHQHLSQTMWLRNLWGMIGFVLAALTGRELYSDDVTAAPQDEAHVKQVEETMLAKALGGRRFWVDVHHFRGWRIQQNVFTKEHRLVDVKDTRFATGSFDECHKILLKIRHDQKLDQTSGHAVVMIHGLLQSSKCMGDMGLTLRDAGYSTIEFDYPSTQITIPETARYLNRFVTSLEGYEEINFVAHSMGGLIVRAYSAEYGDPRIKRLVMLGTPNRGAELADIAQQYWIVRAVTGPSVRQLRTRGDSLISQLPVPKFEFAVIAGSRGTPTGWNPLIPGDDDGTVTVASTKLPGASDFSTVRAVHSRLLWSEEAIAQTVSFLKDGRLRPGSEVQPIRIDDVTHTKALAPKQVPQFSHR